MTSRSTAPPPIPDTLISGVGPGDFWAVGRNTIALVKQFAGLKKGERILDIGSGLGRVAWPLAEELDPSSTYDGFDPCAVYVDYTLKALGLDPLRFRFHHFDIYSGFYNPTGRIRAGEFGFPWAANTFTLEIAASLFTHLLFDDLVHYLREIARTLRPGGRLYATFFVIDDTSRPLIASGQTYPPFLAPTRHGVLADADKVEAGVAVEEAALYEALQTVGLVLEVFQPGSWRKTAGPEYQDVIVARKA